jgi:hypothetical protein
MTVQGFHQARIRRDLSPVNVAGLSFCVLETAQVDHIVITCLFQ